MYITNRYIPTLLNFSFITLIHLKVKVTFEKLITLIEMHETQLKQSSSKIHC